MNDVRTRVVISHDGTPIAYHSLGQGPGLLIVGGVLSAGGDYLALARLLTDDHEVHVIERRGRPGSGPQLLAHSIEDECADVAAVLADTGATAAFGHSFGGLVVLEAARRRASLDELFVYEPGVPLRGALRLEWLDGYRRLLEHGDRRGAFAWMVKHNGHAPRLLASLPLGTVRLALGLGIRGPKWDALDQLLECNLIEHQLLAELDAPSADRFSSITIPTHLLCGDQGPQTAAVALLHELAAVIEDSTVTTLRGAGHTAPVTHPSDIAAAIRRTATQA